MSRKSDTGPKKILFVSPNLAAGGAQRQLINIANGFHRRGYEVSVFLFHDEGNLRDSLDGSIKIFSPSSLKLLERPSLLWILYGTLRLLGTVMTEKPDLLYSRQWPKIPAAVTGKILKVKTVSVEGNNLEHTLLLRKRPLLFRIRRLCARLSDKVVANSRSLAREVTGFRPAIPRREYISRSPRELKDMPSRLLEREKEPVILLAAQLTGGW